MNKATFKAYLEAELAKAVTPSSRAFLEASLAKLR